MPFPSDTNRGRASTGSERRASPSFDHPAATAAGDASLALAELMPAFLQLVDDTIAQVLACPAKPDPTFEGFGELLAVIRSATTLEGTLLEKGIALVASCHPDIDRIHLDRPLPVHEAAKAIFKRNDWAKASTLRLDSQTVTREFYRPDLLLIDGARRLGLMLDIKRSAASCKPRYLVDLRARMMAAALVTRDVLEREYDAPPIARVEIAVIDCSGERRDEARGILTLTDLDWLLGIEGAAAALGHLRRMYGERVRSLLYERCRAIAGPQRLIGGHSAGGGASGRKRRGQESGVDEAGRWADDDAGSTSRHARNGGVHDAFPDDLTGIDADDADGTSDGDPEEDVNAGPRARSDVGHGPGRGHPFSQLTARAAAQRCSVGLAAPRSRA